MASESTPPSHFICPLTREIMQDPVFTRHGYNFERKAILGWLDTVGGVCPVTKQKLHLHDIVTNCALKAEIDDFLSSTLNGSFDEGEEEDYLPHLPTARQCSASIQSLPEEPFVAPSLPQRTESSLMSQNSNLDTKDLSELLNGNISLASSSYRDSRHYQSKHHNERTTTSYKQSVSNTKGPRLSTGLSTIAHRLTNPIKRRANAA